jgi:hypothetical protein
MGKHLVAELTEAEAAEINAILYAELPATIDEAVAAIEEQFPRYTMLHDPEHSGFLREVVTRSLEGFLEQLVDRDVPREDLWAYMRGVGSIEAKEGISREVSQAAFRLGASVGLEKLTVAAQTHPSVTPTVIGTVASAVFVYLNQVEEMVNEGHADTSARKIGDLRERRNALLDLLLNTPYEANRTSVLARDLNWRLPASAAVVALGKPHSPTRAGFALPPDILVGLHRDQPCLVVPDPDGPGRRATLNRGLLHVAAAIGPSTPLPELHRSLDLAVRALPLSGNRRGLLSALDVLPDLLLRQDTTVTTALVDSLLKPLRDHRTRNTSRTNLATTLLTCLENDFNTTAVAQHLALHPQTVRYRLRLIKELFGPVLDDRSKRLALHLALHSFLRNTPSTTPPQAGR